MSDLRNAKEGRRRDLAYQKRLNARRRQAKKERLTLGISALLVLVLIISSIAVNKKRSTPDAKEAVAAGSEAVETISVSEGPYVEPTYTKEEIETAEGIPAISSDFSKVIRVNLAQCVATVYQLGEDGTTETPVKAFPCSPAREGYTTPEGEFFLGEWYDWCTLADGTYGQYAFRIIDNVNNDIMFHSVPYLSMDKGTLEPGEYNKLGTPGSMGCMRVAVRDARWICENCGYGTKVVIYSDAGEELPLGKPDSDFIPPEDTEIAGWDPTDPDPANPWRDYDLTLSIPNVVRVEAGKAISVEEWEKVNFDTSALAPYAQAKDSLGHDITRYLTDSGGYDLNRPGIYQTTVTLKAGPVTATKDITVAVSGAKN